MVMKDYQDTIKHLEMLKKYNPQNGLTDVQRVTQKDSYF